MPYTVAVSFDQFYNNINLAGNHRETANTRRERIVSLLEKDFTIIESFATGSIPRFTAVSGYADVDVIVVLHYTKHIKDRLPSQVLKAVRDSLGEYETRVRRNGQAVTLTYKTWPNVDIVPASRVVNDAGEVTAYNIPDMNREEWLSARPKRHSQNIENRGSNCGAAFRKIIKMAKWWNHQHSSFLQSYHIEVIAINTFTVPLNEMSWDVFQFFDKAHTLAGSLLWHDGSFADAYLDYSSRQEVLKRLATARDLAREAWYATDGSNDDHETAIRKWRQIFGNKFPAYGS